MFGRDVRRGENGGGIAPPVIVAPPDDPDLAAIRVGIVFEKMIVSALVAAAAAGAAHLVIGVAARAIDGALTISGAGNAVVGAVSYACLLFLAGFAGAAAIGIPLFKILEKAKLRKAWPYCLAAVALSLAVLVLLGKAPSFEAPARALHLLPGLAAAILFTRKMRRLWRGPFGSSADRRVH